MSPPNWPSVVVQVEFTAGAWTTLPNVVRKITSARGRQYELATPQAGTLNVTIDCSDGNLDPTNTASIYYPNVRLNKRIRVVANSTSNTGNGALSYYGFTDATPTLGRPQRMVMSPDGTRIYVATASSAAGLQVFDANTYALIASVNVGDQATWVTLSADGYLAYVSRGFGSSLTVVDTSTFAVVATVALTGSYPYGSVLSPDGTKLYVMLYYSSAVAVISTATNTVTATIALPANYSQEVAITPDGTKLYVSSSDNNVHVISTATNTITATIPVGAASNAVTMNAAGTYVYVGAGSTVKVISTATNTIYASLNVAGDNIVFSRDGRRCYFVDAGYIHVLDTATFALANIVMTGAGGPFGLAVSIDDTKIYYFNINTYQFQVEHVVLTPTRKVIFTGYIERYPQRWTNGGNYQFTDLVAADSLAALGRVVLDPIAYSTIGSTGPTGPAMWWALDDAAGSTVAGSRVGGPPLTQLVTRANASAQPGPFLTMGANPSQQAAGMEATTAAGFTPGPNALTISPADMTVLRSPANQRTIPGAGPWTIYCSWSSTAPNLAGVAPNGTRVMVFNAFDGSAYIAIGMTGSDRVQIYAKDSLGVDIASAGVSVAFAYPPDLPNRGPWNNGQQHYSAVSLSADQKTLTYTISDVGAIGYLTKNDGSNWDFSVITSFSVGGEFRPYRNGNFAYNAWTGTVNNVAIWFSEQVSNGGIGEIVKAEMLGYSGDNTVKRFQRLMGLAGRYIDYTGSSTGGSSVQAPVLKGKTLTSALTDLAADEFGTLFVSGEGRVTFNNRASRINPVTKFVFTDRGADGPGVYRYTVLTTDFDAQYLLNDVTVSRKNGVTARSMDPASIAANGTYSTKVTTNIIDDQQAIDRASYTVGRYAQPLPRISSIQISPGTDPNLWNVALLLDLNQVISLTRTPAQGVSFTRSYWVEQISYSIDASNATFTMNLQLSPADVNNYLVLDNTTLGMLDSSNKLAY